MAKSRVKRTIIDGYDFSRKAAITQTAEKIILGFDPSTSMAGVSLYDARADKVLEYEGLDPDRIKEWLMDMLRVYNTEFSRMFARIEIPVKATAYAHARDYVKMLRASNKASYGTKQIEAAKFNIVWSSGMCHDQARRFVNMVQPIMPYELVASEHRMNCENNKLLKGKTGPELEAFFRLQLTCKRDPWIFPTKMSAESIKHFWPDLQVAGDHDLRDALCCSFPEKLYRLVTSRSNTKQA